MTEDNRHIGYYSLVQYCPDHRRREVANVGVALFVPSIGYGDAKLAKEPGRAKSMFGARKVDAKLLSLASKSLRSQFVVEAKSWQSAEGMELFRRKLGNDLLLTKPEVVLVEEPSDELNSLFLDLVGEEKPRKRRRPRTEVPDLSALRQLRLEGLKIDEDVVIPIPGLGEERFEFGYRNGSYNLIDKGAFPSDPADAKQKASIFGTKGQLLHKMTEADPVHRKLIVVANFSDALSRAATEDITTILTGCNAEIVPANELPAFVDRVRKEVHV